MSFISVKFLLAIVAVLVVSVAAVPLPFVWPRGGEEGLKGELRESGVNNRDEIEDTVEFIHSLEKAEGDALMALNGALGFMTAGIRSSKFKVLVSIGLPWGYAKLGGDDLETDVVVEHGVRLLPIFPCVENPDNCDRLREVVRRSDFAMAVPFLIMSKLQAGFPIDGFHKLFQNLFVDTPPPLEEDITIVAALLSLYDHLDMMAIVEQTKLAIGLQRVETLRQTNQLFVSVWNHLRNIADPGRAARQRRDRRPPVVADPAPAPPMLGENNRAIDDHRPPAQFRVWGPDGERIEDDWRGGRPVMANDDMAIPMHPWPEMEVAHAAAPVGGAVVDWLHPEPVAFADGAPVWNDDEPVLPLGFDDAAPEAEPDAEAAVDHDDPGAEDGEDRVPKLGWLRWGRALVGRAAGAVAHAARAAHRAAVDIGAIALDGRDGGPH